MPEQLNVSVDKLTTHVEELRDEVHGEREERQRQSSRVVRWVVLALVVLMLVGASTVSGAYYLIVQNNHKWCGTLQIITAPSPQPTTARGRQTAEELRKLAERFGCDVH
jgi:hypothetical protein